MKRSAKINIMFLIVPVLFIFFRTGYAGVDTAKETNIVLEAMKEEMNRSMENLGKEGTPAPYFISYQVIDTYGASISASYGALGYSSKNRKRLLAVDVRVGSHQLDNTHPIRGRRSGYSDSYTRPVKIALEDDPDAIKSALWLETDKKYKAAVGKLIRIEANKNVTVKEEDQSDDFSKEKPQKYTGGTVVISPDTAAWETKLKDYSALFNGFPEIHQAEVSLRATAENKYFINSEGTTLVHSRTHWRLSIFARTKADDGMQLFKNETFDSRTPGKLPDDEAVKNSIKRLIKDLSALREAPLMEPYTGPAILSGKASAVFFHEIFGHRIEGHRQKDETEGQTFTKQINKEVLPTFISVYDDPTMKQVGNIDLNGHYLYDDEGVKAQRVDLVQKGILKGFLMSRSPIEGFPRSNGHGRSQPGYRPVSRQGNLVVESSGTVPGDKLRKMLLAECKAQGKSYGLFFEDISGGATRTRRFSAQSFNVIPIMVFRVYVDGRPDELVRGVSLIGTPLTSFSKIIACGQTPGIFNGYCGAESGSIPASAISPPVLTTQIEVQKKYKATDKPPVLPPPTRKNLSLTTGDKNKEKMSFDIITRAMKDELDRSLESLQIEYTEKPYFLEYSIVDNRQLRIEASFGASIDSGISHQRLLKVGLRIGSYQLDNTGFLGRNGLYSLIMGHSGNIVVEDDYNVIRNDIWQLTDEAYKQALEQLAGKRAYIKNQVQTEEIPDFSREESVRLTAPLKTISVDFKGNRAKWETLVKNLSGIFRQFPSIHQSRVEMQVKVKHKYYINSEGTVFCRPELLVFLAALASTQAADGMRLTHYIPFYAAAVEDIPGEKELAAGIRQMARQLTALASAPVLENYIGPVLFTGQASGELFAQVLASHFSGQRSPLSSMPQMSQVLFSSKLAPRLNRRVLPRNLSVSDDPTRKVYKKETLIGTYPIDDEGVLARPVTLVEKGILKTLLMSRRPRKEMLKSNGHGRANLTENAGVQVGNLFITAEKGKTYKQLKKELLQLCKYQQLPFGLIIKTFDNPSITGTDLSMSSSMMNATQSDRLMTSPIMIYKVNAVDGREELVRGMVISEIDVKDLKYMAAVGGDTYVHHRLMPAGSGLIGHYYLYRGSSGSGIPTSIVSPSVLFEEIEFKKNEEDRKKPPFLKHPFFSR